MGPLPDFLRQEVVEFRKEQEKINIVQENMDRCQNLTREMLNILDSFEATITELNKTMLPIHKETTQLTNAQKNIEMTLQEVASVQENYNVANEPGNSRECSVVFGVLPRRPSLSGFCCRVVCFRPDHPSAETRVHVCVCPCSGGGS